MVRNAKRWSDGTATAEGLHHQLHISRRPDAEDGNRVVELTWSHAQGVQSTFAEVLEDLGKSHFPHTCAEVLGPRTRKITKPCLP